MRFEVGAEAGIWGVVSSDGSKICHPCAVVGRNHRVLQSRRVKVMVKRPSKKRSPAKAAKKSAARQPELARRGIVKTHPDAVRALLSAKPSGGTIAPGFTPHRALNLKFMGGRTIPKLSFRSFYLGGDGWADSDIQNIDRALSGAMADPHLNNVVQQYFPGTASISTTFSGSAKVPGALAQTYTRDSVNSTLAQLTSNGALKGTDFDNTVVCLFLPPGIILTTDAVDGIGKSKLRGDDNADSSAQGLGGYHGSCHIGTTRIYFAVGVFSQFVGRTANGIPFFPDPWKNVVATFYHELVEARTDPDVEESERARNNKLLGWYSNARGAGEIGDIPMNEAGNQLGMVMVEVALAKGGTAPIQLMWSNAVGGPQGPFT
jgi:hypothetical protein